MHAGIFSSYGPSDLKLMLQRAPREYGASCGEYGDERRSVADRDGCRHNELVLNADVLPRLLPQAIEAVFLPIHGHVDHVSYPSPIISHLIISHHLPSSPIISHHLSLCACRSTT